MFLIKREFTYDEMDKELKKISMEYPFLEFFAIGKSVLRRNIYCAKWGRGEIKILINGAHHGNEWITSLFLTDFLKQLCYWREKYNELFERVTYYICPMINPDGVNLSIKGLTKDYSPAMRERLIKYNKESEDFIGKWQSNINGVDLNHNYDAAFFRGKAFEKLLGIDSPCSTRFSGIKPLSEPESKAIAEFTEIIEPSYTFSYHSQGKQVFYDFDNLASVEMKRIAKKIADLLGYAVDTTDGISGCSGYKDWVIERFFIPSFTIEVGEGVNPLPLSQLDEIIEKNSYMLTHFML